MMKVLQILIIFILLVSCNNLENKQDIGALPIKEQTNDDTVIKNNELLKNEIINNQFANAPLGEFNFIDKKLSSFFKGSYDINKTPTTNKFTSDIDTLIVFQKNNSVVRFYKTKEKVMMDSLNVSDRNFVIFNSGVDINMDKDEVLKIFKVNTKETFSDTISVVDDEGNNSAKFIFKDKKLKKVVILPW